MLIVEIWSTAPPQARWTSLGCLAALLILAAAEGVKVLQRRYPKPDWLWEKAPPFIVMAVVLVLVVWPIVVMSIANPR